MANHFKKELDKNYWIATYKAHNLVHKIKIQGSERTALAEAHRRTVEPFELISIELTVIGKNKKEEKD